MRILKKDLRHSTLVIVSENADDLWILSEILGTGDVVSGKTLRSIKIDHGDTRTAVRKSVFAKVCVEKLDFEGDQLRASGKLLECSEGEKGWHAFEIIIGESVTIERDWKRYEIDRIEHAKTKHPQILVCVMDDSEADFYMLSERMSHLASFRGATGKSYGNSNNDRYYEELLDYMKDKECFRIILAGPGFAKDNMMRLAKEKGIAQKITVDGIAHTGDVGMKEILRRGIVEKIVKSSSIANQTRLVEEFFSSLSKDGRVVYGKDDVRNAVSSGAVSKLIVSDKCVRENEDILKAAENTGAEVKIIYSTHEADERLLALGGFAAFLRYKTEF